MAAMASQDPGHSEAPPLTYRRGSTEVVPEAFPGKFQGKKSHDEVDEE